MKIFIYSTRINGSRTFYGTSGNVHRKTDSMYGESQWFSFLCFLKYFIAVYTEDLIITFHLPAIKFTEVFIVFMLFSERIILYHVFNKSFFKT